ncbi:MAG TPA: hypothetical protein VHE32_09820 [Rhodanobacteraceae bacterium]|jgi:hypothetical protein|nr:hypothetical protein [Rhodanobacteraceae bacterium]
MNRMQEWLACAAKKLDVRVAIAYVAVLSNGMRLPTQALFPDLGGALGTLVFDSADILDSTARRDLIAQGYAISTFSKPLQMEDFDIDSYAEMFSEWGWTSEEMRKPTWMP